MSAEVVELQERLRKGELSRRAFMRRATRLGLSLAAAKVLAACAPTATPWPTDTSKATPGFMTFIYDVQGVNPTSTRVAPTFQAFIPDADNVIPTPPAPVPPRPPSSPLKVAPTSVPTPVPIWAATSTWGCPDCQERFSDQEDMLRHYAEDHARKMPGFKRVGKPTYAQYLRDIGRFDQKDIVFMRVVWDERYQEEIQQFQPRPRRTSEAQAQEGMARIAGAIYADDKAGSFHPAYYGYFGHLQGVDGLYSWDEPVNPNRYPVTDPRQMAELVKTVARFYGADLVGICEIDNNWVYSHYFDRETGNYGELELPYKYAIVMGVEMKWNEGIVESPGFPSSAATALAYSRMAEISAKLAQYIRMLGYPAVPSGNDTTQSIPLAIDAGLGELGRNGLLVSPEFGARQRICKVYTDLPLQVDQPIDFGLQGFCERCRFCAHNCPVQAIPFGDKSLSPTSISNRTGILRWTVDVGRCYLFWTANVAGSQRWNDCSNCVRACPWSAPRRNWL